ncbi:hypothetical protein ABH926_007233 [Catenulispora sp. GP43]|uniref:hypothetical protein n=1 Tax=Catenulispora sp. GP43 TaxID=3156263 RepID=UPI003517817A
MPAAVDKRGTLGCQTGKFWTSPAEVSSHSSTPGPGLTSSAYSTTTVLWLSSPSRNAIARQGRMTS